MPVPVRVCPSASHVPYGAVPLPLFSIGRYLAVGKPFEGSAVAEQAHLTTGIASSPRFFDAEVNGTRSGKYQVAAASSVCKKISRRSEQRRTAGAKDHRRRPASVRVCGRGTAAASGAKPPRSIADCSKAKVRAAENRRLLALPVEQMKFNRNFPWNRIPQPGS